MVSIQGLEGEWHEKWRAVSLTVLGVLVERVRMRVRSLQSVDVDVRLR